MEIGWLALLPLAAWLVWRERRQRAESSRALTGAIGLEVVGGATGEARGWVDGAHVRVRSSHQEIEVRVGPLPPVEVARGDGRREPAARGRVLSGDPEVDGRLTLTSEDPWDAAPLLAAPVRRALVWLVDLGPPGVQVTGRELVLRFPLVTRPDEFALRVRAAVEVVRALPRLDPEVALGEIGRADPVPAVRARALGLLASRPPGRPVLDAVARALLGEGPLDEPALVAALAGAPPVALAAAWRLGAVGTPRAVQPLLDLHARRSDRFERGLVEQALASVRSRVDPGAAGGLALADGGGGLSAVGDEAGALAVGDDSSARVERAARRSYSGPQSG